MACAVHVCLVPGLPIGHTDKARVPPSGSGRIRPIYGHLWNWNAPPMATDTPAESAYQEVSPKHHLRFGKLFERVGAYLEASEEHEIHVDSVVVT